jgi:hypothetical protein
MKTPNHPLNQVQRWMQTVVTHPDGVERGIDSAEARQHIDVTTPSVEEVITRSSTLTSIERLQIYGNAYYARLLECLRDEYPALAHAVGESAFAAFAFGYLQRYPSRSYTLAELGAKFPQYLSETRPTADCDADKPEWSDFLIDLASLERTYSELFDGPGAEGQKLLQADDLLAIPPELWPQARLIPVECLRLMSFRFPVHVYATAVRRHETPDIPVAAETYLAITRRDFIVRRAPLSRIGFALLDALVAGENVEAAIRRAADLVDGKLDELSANMQQWFQNWSAAGYFRAVRLPA